MTNNIAVNSGSNTGGSPSNSYEFLDQLLSQGKALFEQAKTQAAPHSAALKNNSVALKQKSMELAQQSEDILIDKLGIDDTQSARNALRKGLGAGAAAGGLALLLSSRSGRKLATLGGLSALGMMAFKAHKDGTHEHGTMPKSIDGVIGYMKGDAANQRADILLQAMIAAAKADGQISEAEHALITAHYGETNKTVNNRAEDEDDALEILLKRAPDPIKIAKLAENQQMALEIYAISARIADGINPKERAYLDRLAMAMKLDPVITANIETQIRTG